jgi:Fe-S cluster assembly protein SufB
MQRGLSLEDAHHMVIDGFCKGIFKELPFEFAIEASQLLKVSLDGAVG